MTSEELKPLNMPLFQRKLLETLAPHLPASCYEDFENIMRDYVRQKEEIAALKTRNGELELQMKAFDKHFAGTYESATLGNVLNMAVENSVLKKKIESLEKLVQEGLEREDRLIAGIQAFGKHAMDCKEEGSYRSGGDCDCGLDELLEARSRGGE